MRTIVISCDRCGKEIKGYPARIFAEYVAREQGEKIPEDTPFPECAEKIQDKDFCNDCVEKIMRYAFGGMKINPEFEKAVEEMMENDAPATASQEKEEKEDKLPDTGVKGEKPERKKIDMGKILALTRAGWSAPKIAEELGINAQGVYDARYRLKKEGKL